MVDISVLKEMIMMISRVSPLLKNAVCLVFYVVSFFSGAHGETSVQEVWIDFGGSITSGWNKVDVVDQAYDLDNTSGIDTGWQITAGATSTSFNGIDLTDDADYSHAVYDYIKSTDIPVPAYQDSFYTHSSHVREIAISNLNPGATYNLELFYTSNRIDENLVTNYEVNGVNKQIDATGYYSINTNPGFDGFKPITFYNVTPDENDQIFINYSRYVDDGISVGAFGGISTLKIMQVPELSNLATLLALSILMMVLCRRPRQPTM